MAFRFPINKNKLLIAYKLLNDVLFLLLIFFTASLIADGLIPGIISNHVSFTRIIFLVVFNLAAIYFLGNLLSVNSTEEKTDKKTFVFLSAIAALLIFNSLLKLNLFLSIFISIAALAVGYFIYKNIFEGD